MATSFICLVFFHYLRDIDHLPLNFICIFVNYLIAVKLGPLHDLIFRGRRDEGINCGYYRMGFAQKLSSYRANFDIPGCNEAWFHSRCVWYVFLCQLIIIVKFCVIFGCFL